MSAESIPAVAADTTASIASSSQSVWDRITTWASENKAVVYTVAGVTVVVTGAGLVYYLSPRQEKETKTSKKSKRKAKKSAEASTSEEKAAPVETGAFVRSEGR